jgi:hypothetical protein
MKSSGRWFWFQCGHCGWNDIRYRNCKKCPKCKAELRRFRKATDKECQQRLSKAIKEWATIPE